MSATATTRPDIAASLCERIERARSHLRGGQERSPLSETGVHEARKLIKQARALLRLLRPSGSHATARAANRRLRDVGRALSSMRDADVCIRTWEKLADDLQSLDAASYDAVAGCLRVEREKLRLRGRQVSLSEVLRQLGEAEDCVQRLDADGAGPKLLFRAYCRDLASARRDCRQLTRQWETELAHDLRKRVKAALIQCRFLGQDRGSGAKSARALSKLGDQLGEDRDRHLLQERLRDLVTTEDGRRLSEFVDQAVERIESDRRKLRKRIRRKMEQVIEYRPDKS
ncbi:MAG: CHAD domain-containing protein [Phycisphaeraceae bacterium]|nr:CHAD domain-containing protein [Phycisphaeraceae bacterium]